MKVIYKNGKEYKCWHVFKCGEYYVCNNGRYIIREDEVDHVEKL